MGCNARNHPPDCDCGWGGYGHVGRGSSIRSYNSIENWITHVYSPTYNWDYEHIDRITDYSSFVNPNASCPGCGKQVFFYQSPSGGRIFFDALGPPWPKHPCTDHASEPLPIPKGEKVVAQEFWKEYNWIPAICGAIEKEKDIWSISLPYHSHTFYITDDASCIEAGMPMQIREIKSPLYQLSVFDASG